jgi:hypothetical protein
MNNEIEVLKQFFAALNRNDMQGITTYFDPQIVRVVVYLHVWVRLKDSLGRADAAYQVGRGTLRAGEQVKGAL